MKWKNYFNIVKSNIGHTGFKTFAFNVLLDFKSTGHYNKFGKVTLVKYGTIFSGTYLFYKTWYEFNNVVAYAEAKLEDASRIKFDNSFKKIVLDLSSDVLDVNQMRELLASISINKHVGHIKWGIIPECDKELHILKEQIEEKLVFNNKNYIMHPADFVHGLLSSHIYQDVTSGQVVQFAEGSPQYKYNEHLIGWRVQHSYDQLQQECGGYYGASYINEEDGHLVLAHRGTVTRVMDMLKPDLPWDDNMPGIVGGNIVKQQVAAYVVTKQVVQYARNNGYNLSITGHSLGGWLAELSLFFCYKNFGYDISKNNVKAVVFDSPGSLMHMENAESNIIPHEADFDISHLDITTYLSPPNPINTVNQHAGRVYVVPPKIADPHVILKWIADKSKAEALTSVVGHGLNLILGTFNSTAGKPISYQRVLDWPKIEANAKSNYIQQDINAAIDALSMSETGVTSVVVSNGLKESAKVLMSKIPSTTVGKIINVLASYFDASTKVDQFFSSYESLWTQDEAQQDTSLEQLTREVHLKYSGHFKPQKVNLKKDVLVSSNKGSTDYFLKKLLETNAEIIEEYYRDNPSIARQLIAIKQEYEISLVDTKNYIEIKPDSTFTIDELRDQLSRLLMVSKEVQIDIDKFLQNSVNHTSEYFQEKIKINKPSSITITSYFYEPGNECFAEKTVQNHPDLTRSLDNVACVYERLGDRESIEKGLKLQEQALAMLQELYYDQNNPNLAQSLNNIGYTYELLGDSKKALGYVTQAYIMYLKTLGGNHVATRELHCGLSTQTSALLAGICDRSFVTKKRDVFDYVPEEFYESKNSAEELLETGIELRVAVSNDKEVLDIIEKIQYSFNIHSPSIIKQAKNDDIVVFIGNTRGGKSTVVNYVMGNELTVVYDEDSFKKVVIKAFDDLYNKLGPKIGITTLAETTVPTKWIGSFGVIIWDCPGFGDNRGIEQDITNAFYIKELLSHANSVKFVLISNFNDLYNGNIKPLTGLIKGLHIMLPNLEQLLNGVSIIFTKVKLEFKDENVSKLLFNKVIKSGISIDSVEKALVQYFVDNSRSIGIFKEPAEEGNLPPLTLDSSITQAIEHGAAITQDLLIDVTPNISTESEIFLRKHYDAICGTKELCDLLVQVSEFCMKNMEIIKNRVESVGTDRESLVQIREEELLPVGTILKEATEAGVDCLSAMIEKIGDLDPIIKDFIKSSPLLTKIKFVKFVDQVIKPERGKLNMSEVFVNQMQNTLCVMEKDIGCVDLYISLKLNEISKGEAMQRQEVLETECETRLKELKTASEELEKTNKEIVDSKLDISDYLHVAYRSPWSTLKVSGLVLSGVVAPIAAVGVKTGVELVARAVGVAAVGVGVALLAAEGLGYTLSKKDLDQYKHIKNVSKQKQLEIAQKQKTLLEIEQKALITAKELNEKLHIAITTENNALKQLQETQEIEKLVLEEVKNAKTHDQKMSANKELEGAKRAILNAEQRLLEASEEHKQCEATLAEQRKLYESWKEVISLESTLSEQLQKAEAAEKLALEEVEESKTQDQKTSASDKLEIAKQNTLDARQRLLEASEYREQCETAFDRLLSDLTAIDQEESEEQIHDIDLLTLQPGACGVELELVGSADP